MSKTVIYLNDNKIIEIEKLIEFNVTDRIVVNGVDSVVMSRDDSYDNGDIITSVYFEPLFQRVKRESIEVINE